MINFRNNLYYAHKMHLHSSEGCEYVFSRSQFAWVYASTECGLFASFYLDFLFCVVLIIIVLLIDSASFFFIRKRANVRGFISFLFFTNVKELTSMLLKRKGIQSSLSKVTEHGIRILRKKSVFTAINRTLLAQTRRKKKMGESK